MLLSFNSHAQICLPPFVDLGNDTILCPGTSLYLDAGDQASYLWNDGSEKRYLLVSEPGTYSVTVKNECADEAFDEIIISPGENPVVNFIMDSREYFCAGEEVSITADASNSEGSVLYQWLEPDSNNPTISIDTTRNLSVTVTNEDGCQTEKNIFVEFQYPYEKEKILLATYDPSEDKNIVIFSKTREKRTRSYAIYSGNTENDFLGLTDFANTNLFVDRESDPYAGPNYYNLRVVDSCDNQSDLRIEKSHRTIFLEVSTVDESVALLKWGKYRGFDYDYFYIYRGTDPADLMLIDSVANDLKTLEHRYYDQTARMGILYYYTIKVKTPEVIYLDDPDTKKAGSGPFVHSLSNLEDNTLKGTGMNELDYINHYFRIYPNPVSDYSKISYKTESSNDISLSIYDITGNEIVRIPNEENLPGKHEIRFNPKEYGLREGVYILRMNISNTGSLARKLIIYGHY